jgi:hypothetical protein
VGPGAPKVVSSTGQLDEQTTILICIGAGVVAIVLIAIILVICRLVSGVYFKDLFFKLNMFSTVRFYDPGTGSSCA